MIKQETIQKINDTVQIEEVISDFVTLKKRGVNYIGLCPFHDEKTPSFTVSPAKGIYKCFGCGKAGDSVRFVMEHDQLPYPEALKYLAGKYGIEVEETAMSPEAKKANDLRESLFLVNAFAEQYYHDILLNNESGKAIALSYLKERGFDERTIKHFKLGYCLDEWEAFSKAALDKGYKKEYLEQTGLSIPKEDRLIDRYKGRVIFPIHNLSGKVIGFGGRTLRSDKKIAKYVNSPESEIYSKSHQLYGLFFAKKAIVGKDKCYLVEGYTDVVSLFQSGVENAAAPLGTSLTQDQIKLIKRYSKNIVLLFDADDAGRKASLRAIDMILEEGLNVKVVQFPEGEDPDSYSKANSDEALQQFLAENEMGFIDFHLQSKQDGWKDDPIKKAEVMKEILASISKIPDHLLRSLFVKEFSQKLELNEQSVVYELNRIRRKDFKKKVGSPDVILEDQQKKSVQQSETAESEYKENRFKKEEKIVELLFKFGNEKLQFPVKKEDGEQELLEVNVAEYIVSEIEKDQIGFENLQFEKIYKAYLDMLEDEREVSNKEFLDSEDEELRNLAYDLLSVKYDLSQNWKDKYQIHTTLEEKNLEMGVNRALYGLKLSEVIKRLSEFEDKMKEADEKELMELIQFQKSLSEAKRALAEKLGMTLT